MNYADMLAASQGLLLLIRIDSMAAKLLYQGPFPQLDVTMIHCRIQVAEFKTKVS